MLFHIVNTVTIPAPGGIGVTPISQSSMSAAGIILNRLGMADGTIYLGDDGGTGPSFQGTGSSVTLGTGSVAVDGAFHFQSVDI